MKKIILVFLISIFSSCERKISYRNLKNIEVLYISSVYQGHYGGGRFPVQYYHEYIVSSSPRGTDTVFTLEYDVKDGKVPFKFNLGDTLHLNFKR